ncbi:hypothetical protein EI42_03655 [Thermosporothrix hazakensis]|uniref:Uncharacterized protein n=1 Tax=Thermosporothrix hazakensis TaxID=644383 RepID=A0A326U7P0_THEHA|nr:hypothetical protein EI42_03655 [Thermosporothrix hazakensis]
MRQTGNGYGPVAPSRHSLLKGEVVATFSRVCQELDTKTMVKGRMMTRKPYPGDVTDDEWAFVALYRPCTRKCGATSV